MGTMFGFGRAATNNVLAGDPSFFWVTMVFNIALFFVIMPNSYHD